MTVCKAVFSGTVFRTPEKRFTQNNIPITTFAIKVDGNDSLMVRVISMGKAAETVVDNISKNDRVVVEGRLKVAAVKDEDGNEKRVMEVDLSSFEKLGGVDVSNSPKEIAQFSEEEFTDDLIGEDEIPF